MFSVGDRDVDVPLQTNTPRVNPKVKRHGYVDADTELIIPVIENADISRDGTTASSSASLSASTNTDSTGEDKTVKTRWVRRRLVPWPDQMEIIAQCAVGAGVIATLTDFVAHWRGIDPSASQAPSAMQAPNHSIKPFQVSSAAEFLQRAKVHLKSSPYYFFRTAISNGAELGCFVLFRDALRRIVRHRSSDTGIHESLPRLSTASPSSSVSVTKTEVRTVSLTPSFFLTRHLRSGEAWCGVLAGGLSGALCSGIAHPYRVLETTARLEPRFHHAGAVLLAGLRENRMMLFRGLSQGWRMAVLGGAVQCGIQFGGYHILREDGVYRHPMVFFSYCWLASLAGAICRYPCLTLRQHWHHAYSTAPLVPLQVGHPNGERHALTRYAGYSSASHHPQYARRSITYRSIIQVLRRNGGVSKLWDGFFASRPMLRAVPTAVLLFTYDTLVRSAAEVAVPLAYRPHPHASPSQSLTSLQEAARPLPPYEFPTPAERRQARKIT